MNADVSRGLIESIAKQLGVIGASYRRSLSGGLSGSQVHAVQDSKGDQYVIKEIGDGIQPRRLSEIHWLAGWLAEQDHPVERLQAFDAGDRRCTWVSEAGRRWQCVSWVEGVSIDLEFDQVDEAVEETIRRVAQIHRDGRRLADQTGKNTSSLSTSFSFKQRQQTIDRLLNEPPSSWSGLPSPVATACMTANQSWEAMGRSVTADVARLASLDVSPTIAIRDLHRGHVLFHRREDDRLGHFAGIIDLDSLRFDTGIFDIIRYVGDFADRPERSRSWFEMHLGKYLQLADDPVLSASRNGGKWLWSLHAINVWGSIDTWRRWTLGGRPIASTPEAHHRIKHLGRLAATLSDLDVDAVFSLDVKF